MALNLIEVTGNLVDLTGGVPTNARLWFRLDRAEWDSDGNIFAPEYVEVIASTADGSFSIMLQSTLEMASGSQYEAFLKYTDPLDSEQKNFSLGKFSIDAAGPLRLADLLDGASPVGVDPDTIADAIASLASGISTRPEDVSLDAPAFAPTANASAVRTIVSGDDGYHRHFGSMARDERGNLHVVYRRALGHTTYYEGAICHMVLADDGAEIQPETVLVPIQSNWDHEAPQIFVTPEGIMTLVYGSVGLPASSTMPTNFYSMHKHVDADEWSAPSLIGTVASGRNYGRIKMVPAIGAGRKWRLIKPYYGRNPSDQRLLGTMVSDDGGRSWSFGPNVYEGTTYENTEFDIAFVNALYGYAAMRRNSGRLHWLTTTDGGLTWSAPVGATWGTTSDVAPSLDVVYADGVAHLLLGYCDRASDVSAWRWAPAYTVGANPEAFGRTYVQTSTGMLNASGYQCPVIYPSGQMAVVEFVERAYGAGGISDPVATDVRLVWASPANWISGRPIEKTLSMRGATTAGSPAFAAALAWYNKQPNGLVTVNFRIAMSSIGGMVGHLHITGLPYTIKSSPHARPGLSIGFIGGASLSAGQIGVLGFGVAGGTEIALYAQTATGVANLTNVLITDSFTLYGTLTYFTDE